MNGIKSNGMGKSAKSNSAKGVAEPRPRTEERIVIQKKRIAYLDNYQYKETKEFGKNPKPATVIHIGRGNSGAASYEQTAYKKTTTTTQGTATKTKTTTTTKTQSNRQGKDNLRSKSRGAGETSATATKTWTTTTKVGRRGGAGGATSTTTETTSKTTTTRTTRRGK